MHRLSIDDLILSCYSFSMALHCNFHFFRIKILSLIIALLLLRFDSICLSAPKNLTTKRFCLYKDFAFNSICDVVKEKIWASCTSQQQLCYGGWTKKHEMKMLKYAHLTKERKWLDYQVLVISMIRTYTTVTTNAITSKSKNPKQTRLDDENRRKKLLHRLSERRPKRKRKKKNTKKKREKHTDTTST